MIVSDRGYRYLSDAFGAMKKSCSLAEAIAGQRSAPRFVITLCALFSIPCPENLPQKSIYSNIFLAIVPKLSGYVFGGI